MTTQLREPRKIQPIMLNAYEKELVFAAARAANKPVSEWVRTIATRAAVRLLNRLEGDETKKANLP